MLHTGQVPYAEFAGTAPRPGPQEEVKTKNAKGKRREALLTASPSITNDRWKMKNDK
jgi:hypothetical protein